MLDIRIVGRGEGMEMGRREVGKKKGGGGGLGLPRTVTQTSFCSS